MWSVVVEKVTTPDTFNSTCSSAMGQDTGPPLAQNPMSQPYSLHVKREQVEWCNYTLHSKHAQGTMALSGVLSILQVVLLLLHRIFLLHVPSVVSAVTVGRENSIRILTLLSVALCCCQASRWLGWAVSTQAHSYTYKCIRTEPCG